MSATSKTSGFGTSSASSASSSSRPTGNLGSHSVHQSSGPTPFPQFSFPPPNSSTSSEQRDSWSQSRTRRTSAGVRFAAGSSQGRRTNRSSDESESSRSPSPEQSSRRSSSRAHKFHDHKHSDENCTHSRQSNHRQAQHRSFSPQRASQFKSTSCNSSYSTLPKRIESVEEDVQQLSGVVAKAENDIGEMLKNLTQYNSALTQHVAAMSLAHQHQQSQITGLQAQVTQLKTQNEELTRSVNDTCGKRVCRATSACFNSLCCMSRKTVKSLAFPLGASAVLIAGIIYKRVF